MNFSLITLLTVFLCRLPSISCVGLSTFKILPSLPFGQYKLIFKQIKGCNPTRENKMQNNFYLRHNPTSDATEIRGNITLKIPYDDTLFLEASFSRREEDGSWKDNTFIHKSPKACSSFRLLMGTQWTTVMNGLGVKNATCPIPPGVYTAPGLDTSMFSNTNAPKTFIYGTYKLRYYYTRNNEVYGCNIYLLEFKPL